jgi:hypothetical protein
MFNGTTKMRTEKTTIDVVNVVPDGARHLHSGCSVLPANGCGLERVGGGRCNCLRRSGRRQEAT